MRTISRSSYEELNRCPRKYYYRFLYKGTGYESVAPAWDLIYGLSLHVGLETLLVTRSPASAIQEAEAKFLELVGSAAETDPLQFNQLKLLLWGHILGWVRVRAEDFFSTYEVVSIEQEERTVLAPNIVLASRVDAVVREIATGHLYIYNWKSTRDKYDWNSKWNWDIQAWTEALAIENKFDEPVVGCIFEGFYKGSVSRGIYRSPLLWGYRKKVGSDYVYSADSERGKDWKRFSTNDVEAPWGKGIEAWIQWMPMPTLSAQFLTTTPVLKNNDVAEKWLRQIVRRENDIEYILSLQEEEDKLDFFWQNFNRKNCEWCPFSKVCKGMATVESLIDDGLLKPREDHHAEVEDQAVQEL